MTRCSATTKKGTRCKRSCAGRAATCGRHGKGRRHKVRGERQALPLGSWGDTPEENAGRERIRQQLAEEERWARASTPLTSNTNLEGTEEDRRDRVAENMMNDPNVEAPEDWFLGRVGTEARMQAWREQAHRLLLNNILDNNIGYNAARASLAARTPLEALGIQRAAREHADRVTRSLEEWEGREGQAVRRFLQAREEDRERRIQEARRRRLEREGQS
eukprot:jgi/Mesvir1/19821/Mv13111-RA.1